MEQLWEAYLDIETTGLSPSFDAITVIGIYRCNGKEDSDFIQLVGEDVTRENLLKALEGVTTIYTYNGARFDLRFIRDVLDADLTDEFEHVDLMYHCWRQNLYGGFKAVERQLGIHRQLQGVSGYQAVLLWYQYQRYNDQDALDALLQYNKEDVVNLKVLRERLHGQDD
ncbi:MAG: exonuclease [Chloroflexi bacterium]|nr:exonuclease [Chloroflexota bacterium]MBM3175402.1 exonuclease [Chloroflexota bacterium]MBM4452355.1 exonuclease [Chloroflexota bacterium]